MSDPEDASPAGERVADYENPGAAVGNDDDADVPQLEQQEIPEDPSSVNAEEEEKGEEEEEEEKEKHVLDDNLLAAHVQNGDISEITSADASFIDAIPRRAGSPIESVTSAPGDSPSVQVRPAFSMVG